MASPGRKRVTPSPTASTSPARSLPRMSGNEWRISALTPPSRIFEVDGVNAGGAHLDQEVAGPGRRLGQVDDGDRLFVAADGGGFHGGDRLSRNRRSSLRGGRARGSPGRDAARGAGVPGPPSHPNRGPRPSGG